ncbi:MULTISPECIES: PaaI family thioesterase [Pseudofrankia]|uniref:PaaI family thioesterase n=1 Tax=Pseudofrankia TaxID=2994363 RepID=UPI0002DA2504|nr:MULTISPECIES: PaaI family thioesterase [Pseudofrankia]
MACDTTGEAWAGGDWQRPGLSPSGVALCGGCQAAARCRLGIETEHPVDGGVVYTLTCPWEAEGGPRVAHGGWTAGVLDEVVGHVPLLHGQLAVTASLTVGFVKPVPVGRPLRATARLARREGRRWYVEAELTLGSTGTRLATAQAVLVARDQDHFARHEAWLAEQDQSTGASAGRRRADRRGETEG